MPCTTFFRAGCSFGIESILLSLQLVTAPAQSSPSQPPPGPRRTFWQRRLVDPVIAVMTQGVTPDRIAFTLALGSWLSMFPFLGFTSLLNFVVGFRLRLNQPILQAVNHVLGPVHLIMVVVYVRVGEAVWGAERIPFSVPILIDTFRHEPFTEFLHRFGWAGIHAFTAWIISLPLIVLPLNYLLRPAMRKLASQLRTRKESPQVP